MPKRTCGPLSWQTNWLDHTSPLLYIQCRAHIGHTRCVQAAEEAVLAAQVQKHKEDLILRKRMMRLHKKMRVNRCLTEGRAMCLFFSAI